MPNLVTVYLPQIVAAAPALVFLFAARAIYSRIREVIR